MRLSPTSKHSDTVPCILFRPIELYPFKSMGFFLYLLKNYQGILFLSYYLTYFLFFRPCEFSFLFVDLQKEKVALPTTCH